MLGITLGKNDAGSTFFKVRLLLERKNKYRVEKTFSINSNKLVLVLESAVTYRDAQLAELRGEGYYILNPRQSRPRMQKNIFPPNIRISRGTKYKKNVNYNVPIGCKRASFSFGKYGAGAIVLAWASAMKGVRILDVGDAYKIILKTMLELNWEKKEFRRILLLGIKKSKL